MLAFLIVQQRQIIGWLDSNTWAPRTRHAPNGTCAWAHAMFCRRPNAMRTSKDKAAGVYHVYKAVSMVKGINIIEHNKQTWVSAGYDHWNYGKAYGLSWNYTRSEPDLRNFVPAYSKSVCDARKKATEQLDEVNINRETNLPPYLTRVIPSDPAPGAGSVRITQDRWFLGSGSFVEPSFDPGSPRITQDRPDRVGRIVRGIGPRWSPCWPHEHC